MLSKDHHCLESIIEAIDRIIEYTSGFGSADDFNNDYRNFDATMMNFVVIGEMVDKLSDDFKKEYSEIACGDPLKEVPAKPKQIQFFSLKPSSGLS